MFGFWAQASILAYLDILSNLNMSNDKKQFTLRLYAQICYIAVLLSGIKSSLF